MNVLLFYPDPNNAVFYHRLTMPFSYLNGHNGIQVKHNPGTRMTNADLEWCDVLVISRCIDNPVEEIEEVRKAFGFKLIADFDDHYDLPQKHISYHSPLTKKVREQQIAIAGIADQVWVTNTRLRQQFWKYNENTVIIPNAFPFGEGQFKPAYEESERIRFFYAGGRTHQHDIELLEKTCISLRKNAQFKEKGQMILAGYDEGSDTRHPQGRLEIKSYWDAMEDVWSGKRPNSPHFKRLCKLPVQNYMDLYNQADVGLVPLEDNLFNRCKSNLKILECAAKMIPAIVSRVDTFTDNNPPVKWVDKESDWERHIMHYLNNPMEIIEDGKYLHEWAIKHYNLKDTNELRYRAMRSTKVKGEGIKGLECQYLHQFINVSI